MIPVWDLSRVLDLIAKIALVVALWYCFRLFMGGLLTLVVPGILKNVWLDVLKSVFEAQMTKLSSNTPRIFSLFSSLPALWHGWQR